MLTTETTPNTLLETSKPPKIQIGSKEDVLFIGKQLLDSTRANLGGTDDVEILQVAEKRLLQWIEDTFKLASKNIQVNGQEYDLAFKNKVEYEPLNEIHLQTLTSLQEEFANKLESVAAYKKQFMHNMLGLSKDLVEMPSKSVELLSTVFKDEEEALNLELDLDTKVIVDDYNEAFDSLNEYEKKIPKLTNTLEKAQAVLVDFGITGEEAQEKIDQGKKIDLLVNPDGTPRKDRRNLLNELI